MSVKVTPKIPKPNKAVDYEEISNGDTFLYTDGLYVKHDFGNQEAVSLMGEGLWVDDMCGELVVPVDIEIKWKCS